MLAKMLLCTLAGGIALATAAITVPSPAFAADPTCEPAKLATKYPGLAGKKLKIGIPADSHPFSYRDPKDLEEVAGMFVDWSRAAFGCLGIPVQFEVAKFAGILPAVMSGQTDLVWALVFYTPERAKVLDFIVYMKGSSGIVVRKDRPSKIRTMDDLCGLRIGAPAGSVEINEINARSQACAKADKKEIELFVTPDRAAGLRLLDNDRVDANFGIGFKQVYDQSLYTFALTYLSNIEFGVAVKKGNGELAGAIRDALAALHINGTEQKFYDKYEIDAALKLEPRIITQ